LSFHRDIIIISENHPNDLHNFHNSPRQFPTDFNQRNLRDFPPIASLTLKRNHHSVCLAYFTFPPLVARFFFSLFIIISTQYDAVISIMIFWITGVICFMRVCLKM
jgi:hypothetical protein